MVDSLPRRKDGAPGTPKDGVRDVDRHALLTALTTEHFTLQGARASTVNESTARAGLFIGALSSALVAFGFTSQASGDIFAVFVLVALPTLYLLGTFTVVRLVASSIEDIGYGRAINRIRAYYLEVAGDHAHYFMLDGHDDTKGVLANMGITRPSRWQLYFTIASMISVLTAVVGGAATAFLSDQLSASLGVATAVGGATAFASLVFGFRWQRAMHDQARIRGEVLFPSPMTTILPSRASDDFRAEIPS